MCDDSDVMKISSEHVVTKNAYVMFYRKRKIVESTSDKVSEASSPRFMSCNLNQLSITAFTFISNGVILIFKIAIHTVYVSLFALQLMHQLLHDGNSRNVVRSKSSNGFFVVFFGKRLYSNPPCLTAVFERYRDCSSAWELTIALNASHFLNSCERLLQFLAYSETS